MGQKGFKIIMYNGNFLSKQKSVKRKASLTQQNRSGQLEIKRTSKNINQRIIFGELY